MEIERGYLGLPSHIALLNETAIAAVRRHQPGSEAYLTTHRLIKFLGDYETWVSVPLYNINSVHCIGKKLYIQMSLAQKDEIPIVCRDSQEAHDFINQVLWLQSKVMETMGVQAKAAVNS